MDFIISTEKSKLDISLIHHYLAHDSYWAKGRSLEKVKTAIANSLCFAVFKVEGNQQVGFARVVSDYSVFAWILDVFVLEDHQGHGLGKMLMDHIVSHKDLQEVGRWGLNTFDAHGLYERYGFKVVEKPEIHMERIVASDKP